MWRYGGVTEEKKKSMGRYPWNLRPEKSKKPRVATHGLFDAFKEKQGIQNYILLGNKSDLKEKKIVSPIAKMFAEENGQMLFYEVSAKTGDNLNKAFSSIIKKTANSGISAHSSNSDVSSHQKEESTTLSKHSRQNSVKRRWQKKSSYRSEKFFPLPLITPLEIQYLKQDFMETIKPEKEHQDKPYSMEDSVINQTMKHISQNPYRGIPELLEATYKPVKHQKGLVYLPSGKSYLQFASKYYVKKADTSSRRFRSPPHYISPKDLSETAATLGEQILDMSLFFQQPKDELTTKKLKETLKEAKEKYQNINTKFGYKYPTIDLSEEADAPKPAREMSAEEKEFIKRIEGISGCKYDEKEDRWSDPELESLFEERRKKNKELNEIKQRIDEELDRRNQLTAKVSAVETEVSEIQRECKFVLAENGALDSELRSLRQKKATGELDRERVAAEEELAAVKGIADSLRERVIAVRREERDFDVRRKSLEAEIERLNLKLKEAYASLSRVTEMKSKEVTRFNLARERNDNLEWELKLLSVNAREESKEEIEKMRKKVERLSKKV